MQYVPKGQQGKQMQVQKVSLQPLQQQKESVVPRNQSKVSTQKFNIVEHLNKTHVPIFMWDILALPGQKDMLQEALQSLTLSNNALVQQTPTIIMATNANNSQQPSKIVNPPPFYVMVIIGKYLVHNCMIDSGVTSSVMPKKIVD